MDNKTEQQNNGQGFAIASLVIGIFALLFSIIPCVGTSAIFIGIVAVVFGAVALTKTSAANGPKSMSIAGISLGGLAIFVAIIWLVFIIGSKSIIKDRFEHFFKWSDNMEHIDIDDDFEDMESLDNLEKALDNLEGVIDSVSDDAHEVVIEIKGDVKDAINDAREDIDNAKHKKQEEELEEN